MPSLPWTSRTPPNAWPPASFQSWKLCEFIPISAASALNPASVNSSSAALRIPSSIASAPTASSSPPSPTPPNLTILRRMVRCRGRRLGRFDPALRSRSPPLFVFSSLVYPEPRRATRLPAVAGHSPLFLYRMAAPSPNSPCRGRALARLFLLRHPLYIDGQPSGRRPATRRPRGVFRN